LSSDFVDDDSAVVEEEDGEGEVSSTELTTSISQSVDPTLSISPTPPARLLIVPEKGEVISTVALSDLESSENSFV